MRKWSIGIAGDEKRGYFSGVISDKSIKDVLAKTNLRTLIEEYVALPARGGGADGCCPFHEEKTASFKVFVDHYHCFGCGAHGNAIDFLQKHLGMSFPDSARFLAGRIGMALEETQGRNRTCDSDEDRLLKTLDQAWGKYQKLLFEQECNSVLSGLRERGVDDETMTRFGLGYAPESWSTLSGDKAFKRKDLISTGLASPRTNKNGCYDFFRGRVVFPVHNSEGRIVGFGGRLVAGAGPKYLNTEGTSLYHKGSLLFGINQARNAIRKSGVVVVCEGFFDVIIPSQYGFENVVSTCGTGLTEEQIELLFSLSNKLVFCFDGDPAGAKATWRAAEMMVDKLGEEQEVCLCIMPEGHDPDSLVRANGVEAYKSLISGAPTLTEYLAEFITKGAQVPESRARALHKAKALWRRFRSPTVAHFFRQFTCQRLNLSPAEFDALGEASKVSVDTSIFPCPCCHERSFVEQVFDRWRIRCSCGIMSHLCVSKERARTIWNNRVVKANIKSNDRAA